MYDQIEISAAGRKREYVFSLQDSTEKLEFYVRAYEADSIKNKVKYHAFLDSDSCFRDCKFWKWLISRNTGDILSQSIFCARITKGLDLIYVYNSSGNYAPCCILISSKNYFGMFRYLHSSAYKHHNGVYFSLNQACQYLQKAQEISEQFVIILYMLDQMIFKGPFQSKSLYASMVYCINKSLLHQNDLFSRELPTSN